MISGKVTGLQELMDGCEQRNIAMIEGIEIKNANVYITHFLNHTPFQTRQSTCGLRPQHGTPSLPPACLHT